MRGMMSKKIRAIYHRAGLKPPDGKGIHTEKFHRCVVKRKKSGNAVNPYAVCMESLGKEKAINPSHRRSKRKR
jgi:hypothetical protein